MRTASANFKKIKNKINIKRVLNLKNPEIVLKLTMKTY